MMSRLLCILLLGVLYVPTYTSQAKSTSKDLRRLIRLFKDREEGKDDKSVEIDEKVIQAGQGRGNMTDMQNIENKCIDDKVLWGYNTKRVQDVNSQKDCIQLCLDEIEFTCLSIDYRSFQTHISEKLCTLSKENKFTKPSAYQDPTVDGFSYCTVKEEPHCSFYKEEQVCLAPECHWRIDDYYQYADYMNNEYYGYDYFELSDYKPSCEKDCSLYAEKHECVTAGGCQWGRDDSDQYYCFLGPRYQ